MKKALILLISLLTLCIVFSMPCFAADVVEPPVIAAASLSFNGDVHMYFYLYVGEEPEAYLDYGMIFWTEELEANSYTYENAATVGTPATISTKAAATAESYKEHPVQVFTYSVSATQMTDIVYAQGYIKNADGSYKCSEVVPYSVQTYVGNKLGIYPGAAESNVNTDDAFVKMVTKLLEFGTASQEYFDYRTDDLADTILKWSKGLEYTVSGEGTCSVSGIGTCEDTELYIPRIALEGDCAGMKVTGIGESAFNGNSNITSVTVPYGVKTIAANAFYSCSALEEIRLPSSISAIGRVAFQKSSKLARVYISDLASWCGISFTAGGSNPLNCGGDLYINNKKVDGSLEIPHGVKTIGGYAFYGFAKMTSVTIPSSVTSIGRSAFSNCQGLTSIEIPNSVTSIGMDAFTNCYMLSSITIPESVINMGTSPFSGCSGLTSITVKEGNTVYHSAGNCIIETESKTLIAGCNKSTIPVDGSVTSIGNFAFEGCSGLTSVVIPDVVTSIGNYAFSSCSQLTSVVIPDGVTSIGNYAFYGCRSLALIEYGGTTDEWNSISKGDKWDGNTGLYTVVPAVVPTIPTGIMVYYEDFNDASAADELGWTKLNKSDGLGTKNNTATYVLDNGRLKISGGDNESYTIVKNGGYMRAACLGDYTVQYDVEYTGYYNDSSIYFNLLTNFMNKSNYNSVHFRLNGTADNQVYYGDWIDYDVAGDYDADGVDTDTTGPSVISKLTNGATTYVDGDAPMLNRCFTVKLQVSRENGITVWARDNTQEGAEFVCVSKTAANSNGWQYWNAINAYAICLKTRPNITGYIDNIAIWTGLGEMPTDTTTMAYETVIAAK